jgi:hypothetical protein
MANQTADPKESLLALLAETPSLGNGKARDLLHVDGPTYERLKAELLAEGTIKTGRGRGGSIQLVTPSSSSVKNHHGPPRSSAAGVRSGAAKTHSSVAPLPANGQKPRSSAFEQAFRNIDDILWKEAAAPTSWTTPSRPLAPLPEIPRRPGGSDKAAWRPSWKANPMCPSWTQPFRWESWACAEERAAGKLVDHNTAMTGDDLRDFVDHQAVPLAARLQAQSHRPAHHRIQGRRDLRRAQQQDSRAATTCARSWSTWTASTSRRSRREARAERPLRRKRSSAWATPGATAASTTRRAP